MTYANARATDHGRVPLRRVDLAGTAWPLYKLEALALGAIVLVTTLVLVASLQTAVLTATAATVTVWWALLIAETRLPRTESARQAARTQ